MPGNGRIRDIALALARLNQALKSAGLGPVTAVGLLPDDLERLRWLPSADGYVIVRADPGSAPDRMTIIGIPFVEHDRPTEAPPP